MSDQPIYMMCSKTTDKAYVPSVVRNCCKCEHAVWVSSASIVVAEERKANFICIECASELAKKAKDVTVEAPTEAQLEEIVRAGHEL